MGNHIEIIHLKKFLGFHLTLNPSDDATIQGMLQFEREDENMGNKASFILTSGRSDYFDEGWFCL